MCRTWKFSEYPELIMRTKSLLQEVKTDGITEDKMLFTQECPGLYPH